MSAAAWAGIIVEDLDRSLAWYLATLGCSLLDRDGSWAKLGFANGTAIELFVGDREVAATAFPSYGMDPGPPVMPGYAVDDPEGLAEAAVLPVARTLPGWVVVVAPDCLRLVLLQADVGTGRGLVAFRCASSDPDAQRAFLARLGLDEVEIERGAPAVVPVIRGPREAVLIDPDGTTIVQVRRG